MPVTSARFPLIGAVVVPHRSGYRAVTTCQDDARMRTTKQIKPVTHGETADRRLEIAGREIADDTDCYVIAEIGHNHQGSIETCKELFDEAKGCGADAVKLQKRDNRSLFTREFFDKPYENENSFGLTYGEHREALEFGKADYRELQVYADEIGIGFFATAFD